MIIIVFFFIVKSFSSFAMILVDNPLFNVIKYSRALHHPNAYLAPKFVVRSIISILMPFA